MKSTRHEIAGDLLQSPAKISPPTPVQSFSVLPLFLFRVVVVTWSCACSSGALSCFHSPLRTLFFFLD